MKKLLFILLTIMLPLAFSSCNETEENPTNNEITLIEIKCLDVEMNDIENVYYTINQSEYIFKGLYVYAFYSDGSTVDVTTFTSFDKTLFDQIGEYKVNANYKGFSDGFTVIVDEITVKRIECDISNVKVVYKSDEQLDITGLKVYSMLSNDTILEVNDYSYYLYSENSELIRDKKFTKNGKYYVEITYKGKYDYYNIYVYDSNYDSYLDVDLSLLEIKDGKYAYNRNDVIYSSSDIEFISSANSVLNTKKSNGKEVNNVVLGRTFNFEIEIDDVNTLAFEAKNSFKMLIVIDEENAGQNLVINDIDEKNIDLNFANVDGDTYIFVESIKGFYTISSYVLFNIKGIFISVSDDYIFQELKLDTSLVKTIFKQGESFKFNGLVVYGMLNDNESIILDFNDCSITLLFNGSIVTSLNNNGLYVVEVHYKNALNDLTATYNIQVQSSVILFDYIDLDLTDVKINFKKDEHFNYDGLLVYGISEAGMEVINSSKYTVDLYYIKDGITQLVSDFVNSPGSYYVVVTYKNYHQELVKNYDIYYNLGIKEYDEKVKPTITIIEDGKVNIDVAIILESIINVRLYIYSDGDIITSLNSLASTIYNLDKNKIYILQGYYTGKLYGEEYIVYLENTIISFK